MKNYNSKIKVRQKGLPSMEKRIIDRLQYMAKVVNNHAHRGTILEEHIQILKKAVLEHTDVLNDHAEVINENSKCYNDFLEAHDL